MFSLLEEALLTGKNLDVGGWLGAYSDLTECFFSRPSLEPGWLRCPVVKEFLCTMMRKDKKNFLFLPKRKALWRRKKAVRHREKRHRQRELELGWR